MISTASIIFQNKEETRSQKTQKIINDVQMRTLRINGK